MLECDRWPKELKKTRPRRLVWEMLTRSELPLTALDISRSLEQNGTPVWLSTIYRILDTFTERNMIDKMSLDTGMALYEARRSDHRHYAVCLSCKKVVTMNSCPLESFMPRLSEQDFFTLGHRLQIFGYCGVCSKSLSLN